MGRHNVSSSVKFVIESNKYCCAIPSLNSHGCVAYRWVYVQVYMSPCMCIQILLMELLSGISEEHGF